MTLSTMQTIEEIKCEFCDRPADETYRLSCGHDLHICPDENDEIDRPRHCGNPECDEATRYPRFINVYRVEQSYGGREEGGWWYDVGEPLESIRVDSREEEEAVRAKLEKRYEPDPEDREHARGRCSAAGGYDINISSEEHFADFYPKKKPRYE